MKQRTTSPVHFVRAIAIVADALVVAYLASLFAGWIR